MTMTGSRHHAAQPRSLRHASARAVLLALLLLVLVLVLAAPPAVRGQPPQHLHRLHSMGLYGVDDVRDASSSSIDAQGLEEGVETTTSAVRLLQQMVDQGAEQMGQHLETFFTSLGRLVHHRQRSYQYLDPSSSSSSMDASINPYFVERVFHPPAAKATQQHQQQYQYQYQQQRRSEVAREDGGPEGGDASIDCNPPFGTRHPACSPLYACSPARMSCDGQDVDVKTYNGSLSNCTVGQVSCANGPAPALSKRACALQELMCNGSRTKAADAPPGAAATCSIYQLMCANNTLLNFDPSSSTCDTETPSKFACESVCKKAGYVCSCSLDRIGTTCAKWRPYTCTFKLLSPQPNCQPSNWVDSDPVCFVYRRQQTVSFDYTIDCAFDDHNPIPDQADEFQYFLRTKKFAVSKAQTDLWPMQAQLKVFDFNWISDRSQTQVTNLTALQLAGNSTVSFPLSFDKIPDRFFAGNRLYFEFGLSRLSSVKGRTIKYDRRFIDFEGLHISRSTHSSLSAAQISWIIAGSIAGFALLVLLGYWLRNKIIACRRPKEHDY